MTSIMKMPLDLMPKPRARRVKDGVHVPKVTLAHGGGG